MGKLNGTYNPQYARNLFQRVKRIGGERILFDELVILNGQNLHERTDKQRLYISNHLSHADYMLQWYAFHNESLKVPRIPAGENLNLWPLRLIGMDLGQAGAFFIDRRLFQNGNGVEKRAHGKALHETVREIAQKEEDILVYPEMGRNYGGETFQKYKTGIIRALLRNTDEIDIVNLAMGYDYRIEERVFEMLKKYKPQHGKLNQSRYIWLDAKVFLKRFFERVLASKKVGQAYWNIGTPTPLHHLTTPDSSLEGKVQAVKDFSISGIKRLLEEIQVVKDS